MWRLFSIFSLAPVALLLAGGVLYQPATPVDSPPLPFTSEVCFAEVSATAGPVATISQGQPQSQASPALPELAIQDFRLRETELRRAERLPGGSGSTCRTEKRPELAVVVKPVYRVTPHLRGKPEFHSALAAARNGSVSAPSTAPPSLG